MGMRRLFCLLACLAVSACFPVSPPAPGPRVAARTQLHHLAPPSALPPPAAVKVAPPQRPAIPVAPPQLTSCEMAGIRFEGVAFDARSHRLIVADQPAGPGTRWPDAATAASAHGGLAAINAGFFTPTGQPLGKLVAAGTPAGSWNRASSLGSGVWLESPSGTSAIFRRESVPASVAAQELVQAGPMLVENRQVVAGLEATKSSVRSVILWDGGTRWWIGHASPCTLAALARALVAGGPAAWSPRVALNLDGGRSADLCITAAIPGGPVTRRALWNKPVRNFLVLVSR